MDDLPEEEWLKAASRYLDRSSPAHAEMTGQQYKEGVFEIMFPDGTFAIWKYKPWTGGEDINNVVAYRLAALLGFEGLVAPAIYLEDSVFGVGLLMRRVDGSEGSPTLAQRMSLSGQQAGFIDVLARILDRVTIDNSIVAADGRVKLIDCDQMYWGAPARVDVWSSEGEGDPVGWRKDVKFAQSIYADANYGRPLHPEVLDSLRIARARTNFYSELDALLEMSSWGAQLSADGRSPHLNLVLGLIDRALEITSAHPQGHFPSRDEYNEIWDSTIEP